MKKKWMKILLIINMFLCLFGVQEFRNKNYVASNAATTTRTIYVDSSNCAGWASNHWNQVSLYAWGGTNGENGPYPGVSMTRINSQTYVFQLDIDSDCTHIIINNGDKNGDNLYNKTQNILLNSSTNYYVIKVDQVNGGYRTYDTYNIPYYNYSNVYFDLRGLDWSNPNIYTWRENNINKKLENNTWPGKTFSNSGINKISNVNGLYQISNFSGIFDKMIINNGSGSPQTGDFLNLASSLNGKNCFKVKKNKDGSYSIEATELYKVIAYIDGVPTTYYVSLLSDIPNPQKDYHSFDGWYTTASGSQRVDSLSTSYFPNYSGTIYAHFTRNKKQLTVIDDGVSTLIEVDEGTTIQENISPKGKEGYTFKHWSTSASGPQISGSTIITSNMTLYAVYEINKYTVTYQYMTGITGPSLGTETVNHGGSITKTDLTLDGYKFDGWFTDAGCTTAFDKTTVITNHTTLYAKFVAAYTVTYKDGDEILFTEPCVAGDKISHTEGPEKTGYTFNCWCTDSELNNAYDNNTAITSNLTLYAKYDINNYTITFNDDGKTTTRGVNYNNPIRELPTPTKTGYDFQHWVWDSLDSNEIVSADDVITDNRTAYAVYTIHVYKITLNNDGTTSTIDRNYNTMIGELDAPTKTGYDFQYWAWDSLTGPKVNSTDVITADRTAYAVYTIHKYTVTFKLDEDTIHDTKYVNYNTAIGALPDNPEKTGYTFVGWKLSNGTAITSDSVITSDCTVYANFNINSYTVTFHYGENVNTTTSKELNYNTELKSSEFGVDTSWADHRFVGWYYDSSYTRIFTDGDRVSGDIDLYAKYSESSYRYVYVDGSKLTDCFIDSNTYVHMYSSSAGTTWPGTKENVTYIGNKIVRIKVDVSIYTNIIVNNGVESSSATLHGKESKSITLNDNEIYYTLIDEYVIDGYAYKYSFTSETKPANLLKAQVANISGDLDMYRFTMGATNDALYGFKFVFINGSSSDIRYWNFSKESMLTQVRFGSGEANLYKPGTYNGVTYDGYYSLTIKETSSFKLTNYDQVLVLACCKDSTGVNVVKAVEYTIDKNTGALSR